MICINTFFTVQILCNDVPCGSNNDKYLFSLFHRIQWANATIVNTVAMRIVLWQFLGVIKTNKEN